MENDLQHKSVTPRDFTFHLLEQITNRFSKDHIVGRGGYGVVYKGVLDNGEEIAVKKLYNKHPGLEDDKQFTNECTNLMRLQHQNIVRLVGYCYEIAHKVVEYNGQYVYAGVEERALCFEYLHGGTLEKLLSGESCGLDWHTCYKIIRGVCEGLHYLHNGSKHPIYHLDLKPANIMLDKNMVPKIGDFGLSRLFDSTQTCTTKTIIGTPGYMPPEYINRYQITQKFDIFSLGVIIIQVLAGSGGYMKCGNMSNQEFSDLVHGNWGKRLQVTMSSHMLLEMKTCIKIALRCVESDRVKRPTIAEIVDELNKVDDAKRSLDELNKIDDAKRSLADEDNLHSRQVSLFRVACKSAPATCHLPANNIFLSQQINTNHQPPANRTKQLYTNSSSRQTSLVRVAYKSAPATCHLPANNIFFSQQINTNHQPPADRTKWLYTNSGAADAEGALTVDQRNDGKEQERVTLEDDPSDTEYPGPRTGGTSESFRSMWAMVKPTLKAKSGGSEGHDDLLWCHDLAHFQDGVFSAAAMQANYFMEDQCLVESGLPFGTVFGVFDGHGGPQAACFIRDHIVPNLKEASSGQQGMTVEAIREAFLATEKGFITLVSRQWETKPSLATVGSCCLVGIVHQKTLSIADLGDSRAVLGRFVRATGEVLAMQLSVEHNACYEEVRNELSAEHPDDPDIVLKHNIWRVKGIMQISRSIGDACLKYPQYNMGSLHSKFRLPTPFSKPVLSASPSIVSHSLQPSDHFLILASDGLWEHLSNQEAVDIVQKHQRAAGTARQLIKAALLAAAPKRAMTYSDLKKIDRGVRRQFHDDITVIIVFFNHAVQPLSIRCPLDNGSNVR